MFRNESGHRGTLEWKCRENVKQAEERDGGHLIKAGYFSCLINYAGSGHAKEPRESERVNKFPGRFERKAGESLDACAPSDRGLK